MVAVAAATYRFPRSEIRRHGKALLLSNPNRASGSAGHTWGGYTKRPRRRGKIKEKRERNLYVPVHFVGQVGRKKQTEKEKNHETEKTHRRGDTRCNVHAAVRECASAPTTESSAYRVYVMRAITEACGGRDGTCDRNARKGVIHRLGVAGRARGVKKSMPPRPRRNGRPPPQPIPRCQRQHARRLCAKTTYAHSTQRSRGTHVFAHDAPVLQARASSSPPLDVELDIII